MIDLRFSSDHVWVRLDDDGFATVGVTDYAEAEIGEAMYIEAPEAGRDIVPGEEIGMIESDAGTFELRAPTSGTVTEINAALVDNPELVNESPMDDGWIFRMNVVDESALEELMDEDDYADYLDSRD